MVKDAINYLGLYILKKLKCVKEMLQRTLFYNDFISDLLIYQEACEWGHHGGQNGMALSSVSPVSVLVSVLTTDTP